MTTLTSWDTATGPPSLKAHDTGFFRALEKLVPGLLRSGCRVSVTRRNSDPFGKPPYKVYLKARSDKTLCTVGISTYSPPPWSPEVIEEIAESFNRALQSKILPNYNEPLNFLRPLPLRRVIKGGTYGEYLERITRSSVSRAASVPIFTQAAFTLLFTPTYQGDSEMSFDADQFMQSNFTDAASTKRTLVPAGWFHAIIQDDQSSKWNKIQASSGISEKTDSRFYWMMMKVPFKIQAPEVPQIHERTVTATIFMDCLQEDSDAVLAGTHQPGMPDFSEEKNTTLGKLRKALDQNTPGQPWNPHMMAGQNVLVQVAHEPNQKRPTEPPYAVAVAFQKFEGIAPPVPALAVA